MNAILTSTACDTCVIVPSMAHMETTYFTINGSNMVACLAHAVEMEESNQGYTFQPVTPDVAAYLLAA